MQESSGRRSHGVEFGEFGERVEELEYPVAAPELVTRYGTMEIGVLGETQTVASVLEDHAACNARYDSPRDVREAICCLVPASAVGRRGYSDRGAQASNDGHDSL